MLPEHLLTYAVTIVRQGETTDRYGQTAPDWSKATRIHTRGFLGQNVSREVLDGRDAQIADYQLFLPTGTDISGHDRVEIDGASFEVVGPPLVRRTPDGPHHVEARLRAISG